MIYFVRHGETVNNLRKIFYGQDDGPELTVTGRRQAQAVAEKLRKIPFDVCYCSPRLRTKQTMQIIMQYHPQTPVIFDERLAERNWGQAVGLPVQVCEPQRWRRDRQFTYAGIESVDAMQKRLYEFYHALDLSQTILVVSHSGCYRVSHAMFHSLPPDGDFDHLAKIPNGAYVQFDTEPRLF